jgi:hypothetical protein
LAALYGRCSCYDPWIIRIRQNTAPRLGVRAGQRKLKGIDLGERGVLNIDGRENHVGCGVSGQLIFIACFKEMVKVASSFWCLV